MITMTLTDHQLALAAYLCVFGSIAHLTADWLFQDNNIAGKKMVWRSWQAWVHILGHTILLLFVFSIGTSIGLAISHLIIDTRKPLDAWSEVVSRPETDAPIRMHVDIWRDQVLHLLLIAATAYLQARWF